MYEITLQGSPPASLTARFPAIKWHLASAATILSRRVADPAEVDKLARCETPRSRVLAILMVCLALLALWRWPETGFRSTV